MLRLSRQLFRAPDTFLVDHPVLGRRAADGSDRELLVHFKDIVQIGKESDAEILDARDGCHRRGRAGCTISGDIHSW